MLPGEIKTADRKKALLTSLVSVCYIQYRVLQYFVMGADEPTARAHAYMDLAILNVKVRNLRVKELVQRKIMFALSFQKFDIYFNDNKCNSINAYTYACGLMHQGLISIVTTNIYLRTLKVPIPLPCCCK